MSKPPAIRHINEVRLVELLYKRGPATRADLARQLGLTRSTVGILVGRLMEQGRVSDVDAHVDAATGRIGRPGQLVRLNPERSVFVGVDIAVGRVTGVTVDLGGTVTRSLTRPFEARPGEVQEPVGLAVQLIQELMHGLRPTQTVEGMTVVVPGLVTGCGVVHRAPALGWNQVPLKQLIGERLGWESGLHVENDANAFAAAELSLNPSISDTHRLFVFLDCGVGGAIASSGQIVRGHRGHAGEIGHILLGERGFVPGVAVEGSFESFVGRDAILARYRHHGGPVALWSEFCGALRSPTPPVRRALDDWALWMGRGLASLVAVLDPERITLGGPVACVYAHASDAVAQHLARNLAPGSAGPRIDVSGLGLDACAIGGAMLVHARHLALDERLVYGDRTPAV